MIADPNEPRRGFPAQSMPWDVRTLNRWHREDAQRGAEEWPLPVSGDATAWAAGGDRAAWAAMAT